MRSFRGTERAALGFRLTAVYLSCANVNMVCFAIPVAVVRTVFHVAVNFH